MGLRELSKSATGWVAMTLTVAPCPTVGAVGEFTTTRTFYLPREEAERAVAALEATAKAHAPG